MRFRAAILLSFIVSITVFAQQQQQQQLPSRTELERERQKLLESIKETQEQLANTKSDQQATLSQLRALQAKLSSRERLIANYNQELGSIDNNIQNSTKEVMTLQQTLEMQKIHYAQSVRYSYKNRNSYDMLAFMFSSSDFNDAVRRLKYLKKYRDYRTEQVAQIAGTQTQIQNKMGVLKGQRTQKEELLNTEKAQKEEIVKEKNQTDQIVNQLKGREKELSAQIERNRKAAKQVDAQVAKIIQREIDLAMKKAAEEEKRKREEEQRKAAAALAAQNNYGNVNLATGSNSGRNPITVTNPTVKPGTTTPATNNNNNAANNNANSKAYTLAPKSVREAPSYMLSLTPEAAALSNSFEANRGRLPWPVEKGFVSLRYGPYEHPTEKHVKLDNPGVLISTTANAVARAVFDGEVSTAMYINGAGWTLIINHGQYYTVYTGLASTSVKRGDKVKIKQAIGVVGENDEGVPTINFQVWRVGSNNKSAKVDPSGWIAR